MGFLGALADQISSQFSLGENTNHSLDSIDLDSGKTVKYGSLGDFAQHFDQSAERRYVEEGYLRKDPYNTDPKQFEVLFQEPSATVLIKKKMFSSVSDNFRPDFMDADEKLYYKAMKILFQNKCAQIAALEKLAKIQKITSAAGNVSSQLIPIIISLTDSFNNGLDTGSNLFGALGSSSPLGGGDPSNFTKVVDTLRRIYAFNTASTVTSWITDSTNLFQSQFGQGTGVIEVTNFTNLTTSVSTELTSPGNFSLTISDPYEFMLINEYDIEKAISDATNMFYNSKINQFAKQSATQLVNENVTRLNQARAARNASPISFKIDPDTLLGKRVTAVLDRLGIELPFTYDSSSAAAIFSGGAFGSGAQIPPEYLKGGSIAGNDGLSSDKLKIPGSNVKRLVSDSEVSLFNRIVSTIFSKLSQDANSQNAFQLMNDDTNYARRKLRFNFSGKLIIQPMDVVHIYVNSKSRYDTKLLSGLQSMFSGLGILQNLNNTIAGLKNAATTLFNPSGNIPLQVEKAAFVGAEFPNFLWSMVRGQFVSENEGTHVFAGLVDSASDNWSDGKFTIEVRGGDNTTYFKQGKINFKPGVDIYNGSIFDPLTPFKSNFDTIASTDAFGSSSDGKIQLLNENLFLLGTSLVSHDSLVKFKLGDIPGYPVTNDNIIGDKNFDFVTGRTTRIFYAPDGLVYKWKEGIGVFTQGGSSSNMNDPNRVGNPNINKEPFAGQDVMNVLSLLITGVPYNFATYFKATQNIDGFGADPQSGQSATHSFMASLRDDLVRTNTLWGNFVPFKNLSIDEQSYVKALQGQTSIIQKNQVLDRQIRELQDLNNKAMLEGAVNALADKSKYSNISGDFLATKSKATALQDQINANIAAIQKENASYLRQSGDDTSFDASEFNDSQPTGTKSASEPSLRRLLRRQLNFLTRRMSYNVRANEDKNLFIVDDFYDKDFDILAYNKALTDGLKIFNNEFTSVDQKIDQTAKLLNLEVFADTQGHIRVRPPQYNRMPSSVFYKMMYLKDALKIQVFPDFLSDMFNTKLDALRTRIEILEDQIRLDCALLDYVDDKEAAFFIKTSDALAGNADPFQFVSDENGHVTEIADMMTASNPDLRKGASPIARDTFETLGKQASIKNVFTNAAKYSAIVTSLKEQELNASGIPTLSPPPILGNERVNALVDRIQTKSGQKIDKSDYLVQNSSGFLDVQPPIGVTIDIFKINQEISDKIKERQKVLRLFYSTIKNAQEFKSLDTDSTKTANRLVAGGYGNSHIPEVFEHMIEDETYDDYGLDSGKRYIIKRSQIKQLTIQENPPPWTTVEVQGILDPNLPDARLVGFDAFPSGGNGLVSALAVDYDMWRNYGFKEPAVVSAPFLSDPISQCGPYASMLLSRNRKDVLRGTLTISGNEFMQPGEVIFLEDRGMLFYVKSVRHSFSQGSSFTTTLELSYGHTPGEYIPTVMDTIGKMLYNNKDVGTTIVQRQDTSGEEINVGVVLLSPTGSISKSLGVDGIPPSSFSAANSQVINNILYSVAAQFHANDTEGTNVKATLELRTYYDENSGATNDNLLEFAGRVSDILSGFDTPALNSVTAKHGNPPGALNPEWVADVNKTQVNLDISADRRSPSQKAIDSARNLSSQTSTNGTPDIALGGKKSKDSTGQQNIRVQKAKIRKALFENVVDIWVKVENIPNVPKK